MKNIIKDPKKMYDPINDLLDNLIAYKQMQNTVTCPIQYAYIEKLIQTEKNKIKKLLIKTDNISQIDKKREQEFTIKELGEFDGTGGKPAYAAIDGIVYDLSIEGSWAGGTHFGLTAGKDLTNEFNKCHNKEAILGKLKRIGILK